MITLHSNIVFRVTKKVASIFSSFNKPYIILNNITSPTNIKNSVF